MALLKGIKEEHLGKIAENLPLTYGADLVAKTLKGLGYKLGILSGGFTFMGEYLKERLEFDYMYANELDIKNGKVTGEVKGEIVDGEQKAILLRQLAQKENIVLEQTIAVGDGANDRFMLENAGLAIAFSPKEILKEYSDGMITSDNIFGLLYFLGVPDSQLEMLREIKDKAGE